MGDVEYDDEGRDFGSSQIFDNSGCTGRFWTIPRAVCVSARCVLRLVSR